MSHLLAVQGCSRGSTYLSCHHTKDLLKLFLVTCNFEFELLLSGPFLAYQFFEMSIIVVVYYYSASGTRMKKPSYVFWFISHLSYHPSRNYSLIAYLVTRYPCCLTANFFASHGPPYYHFLITHYYFNFPSTHHHFSVTSLTRILTLS